MVSRLKVLVSVYACDPRQGSEQQVGWTWVRQLSEVHDVWAITAEENREQIELYNRENDPPNVHWIFYQLPNWMRFWYRPPRGERLYYNLWQWGIYGLARQLHQQIGFDVVHHITYCQYWSGSHLSKLPTNFVWGPVGGGERAPKSFLRSFDKFGRRYEILRDIGRITGHFRPVVRTSARRATAAYGSTHETSVEMMKLGARNVQTLSSIALSGDDYAVLSQLPPKTSGTIRFMSVGRLLHWKGFHLGLLAFARIAKDFPSAQYVVIGDGPYCNRLKVLTQQYAIEDQVRFVANLPREQVLLEFSQADALVHPSLHESAGMVVLEAQAAGRPVICMDLGGPGVLVPAEHGFRIPAHDPEQAVDAMAEAMRTIAMKPEVAREMGLRARQWTFENYCWDTRKDWLAQFYDIALLRPLQR